MVSRVSVWIKRKIFWMFGTWLCTVNSPIWGILYLSLVLHRDMLVYLRCTMLPKVFFWMLWILAFKGGFRLMVLLLWFCFSCGTGFSVVRDHKSRIMFVCSHCFCIFLLFNL